MIVYTKGWTSTIVSHPLTRHSATLYLESKRYRAHVAGTGTGGYGKNAQGDSFSRFNQMGTDQGAAVFDDDDNEGKKTGYSTPGYRLEDGECGITGFQRSDVSC